MDQNVQLFCIMRPRAKFKVTTLLIIPATVLVHEIGAILVEFNQWLLNVRKKQHIDCAKTANDCWRLPSNRAVGVKDCLCLVSSYGSLHFILTISTSYLGIPNIFKLKIKNDSRVVQNDSWLPNSIRNNSDMLDPSVLSRVPSQSFITPLNVQKYVGDHHLVTNINIHHLNQ